MRIKAAFLDEVYGGDELELEEADVDDADYIGAKVKLIDNEMYDRGRWSVEYFRTYQITCLSGFVGLWGCNYSSPATETQDGQDRWDADKNGMVTMTEMEAVEKTVISYRVKKQQNDANTSE